MAGGLAAIGATVAIFVSVRDMKRRHRTNKPKQPTHPTSQLEVATQAPLAILGGLPTLPGGGATALKVAQLLGRNYPLVLLTALIGLLFWPTSRDKRKQPVEPMWRQPFLRSSPTARTKLRPVYAGTRPPTPRQPIASVGK
jgi:hypothetical protein